MPDYLDHNHIRGLEAEVRELRTLLEKIITRAEWNGFRQAWEIRPDLPAGTINAARAALQKEPQS